jgi:hypothetical protein
MQMVALVVFSREMDHWLGGRLHPDFKHVYCVVPTAHQHSTEINLTCVGIQTKTFDGTPMELQEEYNGFSDTSHTKLIQYDPAKRHLLPHSLNNCVGLTKQLLGLTTWALTPYQLFKEVERNHAY